MGMILIFVINLFSDAGGEFLTITPGARQIAMGSAFTGVADDITAVYYNPGGLAFCKNLEIGCMNPFGKPAWLPGLYPGMKYIYSGGVAPLPSQMGLFGFGYSYLSTGITERIDEFGNLIGKWESYENALTFSYGKEIAKNVGMGVSLKYVYIFLAPDQIIWERYRKHGGDARTLAFDWGELYKTPIPGLSVGVSGQNLWGSLRYVEDGVADQMPSLVRAGFGFSSTPLLKEYLPLFISEINFSGDIVRDLVGTEYDNWYCGGSEFILKKIFALRGGYFYDERGKRKGATFGCGVNVGFLQIDVANDSELYEFPTDSWRLQINVKPLYFYNRKK